jgi:hypothetical protein
MASLARTEVFAADEIAIVQVMNRTDLRWLMLCLEREMKSDSR